MADFEGSLGRLVSSSPLTGAVEYFWLSAHVRGLKLTLENVFKIRHV
jgi:hypothetical protein